MAVRIIMLGLLALVGYIAGRSGYLPEGTGISLSKVVVKLTAPILILCTMASRSFTGDEIQDGIKIFLLALTFMLLSVAIGKLITRKLSLGDSTKNIYLMHTMFGNVVFLAFPLIESVYGKEWLIYAVFFNLANDALLWTLGIYLVNRHNTSSLRSNLKHLVNGNTVAFFSGVIFIIIDLQGIVNSSQAAKSIYDTIYGAFYPLGETTVPLSMLFIGLILSETKIGGLNDIKKRYPSFVLTFFKLIFIPMTALLLLNLLGGLISPTVKGIVVLQLAMPCGTIVSALSAQYESDYMFATENVFISTLLSVATLPLMAWLVKL